MCFVQKDINLTSVRDGAYEYDLFFTKLSDFDQY